MTKPQCWWLLVVFAVVSFPTTVLAQQDDPASRVCLALLKQNVQDTNNVYSEQFHYEQYQNILKTANFSSYQQYSDQGGGLGITIPIADALIGFKGDYKTNSNTFQQEMSQFLSTNYAQSTTQYFYSQQTATMNSQLLAVAKDCQDHYYNTLKDRAQLSVTVEPDNFSEFVVKIVGYIPPPYDQHLKFQVTQIEPIPAVKCTESGRPVRLPETPTNGIALMTCTKDRNSNVQLAVATNLGLSQPLNLPQYEPPASNPPEDEATQITWKSDHPVAFPQWLFSPCVSAFSETDRKHLHVINNCDVSVPVLGMKDTEPNGFYSDPLLLRSGRSFAYFVLGPGKNAVLDMSNSTRGFVFILAAPGVTVAVARLMCRTGPAPPNPAALYAPVPYSCVGDQSGKVGDSCSCPKVPSGTVSGKLDQ